MHRWIARAIYYPTLGYNWLLGRALGVRRWWDFVHEQVILGARPLQGDAQRLKDLGVSGVVNMCEELPGPLEEYERLGIEQLWLPTVDFNHPSRRDVDRGADFIQDKIDHGGKVYVHCKAGRARSATIVLWWLIKHQGLSPEDAQAQILASRPHANPRVFERPVIRELHSDWLEKSASDDVDISGDGGDR